MSEYDGHTIDVGYVHTLTGEGTCRGDCPHPDHLTAPTGTEVTTARIVEVLAEHEPNGFSCACGWRNETATYATAHRAHVAALLSAGVIRDMQAAALREAADDEDWRGVMFNRDGLDLSPADRVRHRLRDRAARIEEDA